MSFLQNRKSYIHITPTTTNPPVRDEHHLFVKFSALALPVNEPCDLFFFIYDGRLSKVLRSVFMPCSLKAFLLTLSLSLPLSPLSLALSPSPSLSHSLSLSPPLSL